MNHGKGVAIARVKSGLSQREMAKRAGLSHAYASLIESNKRIPGDGTIKAIARALDVPPIAILLYSLDEGDMLGANAETISGIDAACAAVGLPKESQAI